MKTYASVLAVAALALLAGGCASAPAAPKSGIELQAYQAKEFETSKRAAFSATMSVFQDLGFIIDDGDFDTGLITATGPSNRHSMDMGDLLAQVFAGTDWGLYFTNDIDAAEPSWVRFNDGLPSVMIWDMAIDAGFTTLALFTRSRGAFVWPLPNPGLDFISGFEEAPEE